MSKFYGELNRRDREARANLMPGRVAYGEAPDEGDCEPPVSVPETRPAAEKPGRPATGSEDERYELWRNGYAHGHEDAQRGVWQPEDTRRLYGAATALRARLRPESQGEEEPWPDETNKPQHRVRCDEYHSHTRLGIAWDAEVRCCADDCPGCAWEREHNNDTQGAEPLGYVVVRRESHPDGYERHTVNPQVFAAANPPHPKPVVDPHGIRYTWTVAVVVPTEEEG